MSHRRLPGCILSTEPLVTFSKRAPSLSLEVGMMGVRRNIAQVIPSFNILTLAWSHESRGAVLKLKQDLDQMATQAPLARFLVIANTQKEFEIFQSQGIAAAQGNVLCLADADRFTIVPPTPEMSRFDAVYVAGFQPFKRHALARTLDSLMLLYWPPRPDEAVAMRQLLPEAALANHEVEDGCFKLLDGAPYCQQLGRAKVGLCLSAEEGPMRASIEYMLCGLPVVSTPARGGRIEMLEGPHLTLAAPDTAAVAAAVASLALAPPDPAAVRAQILQRMEGERQRLMSGINAWLAAQSVPALGSDALTRMIRDGVWRNRAEGEVFRPLAGLGLPG